jgi:hypothetical protein
VLGVVLLIGPEILGGVVDALEEQDEAADPDVGLHLDHEAEDLSGLGLALDSQLHFRLNHLDVLFVLGHDGLQICFVERLVGDFDSVLEHVVVVEFYDLHE